MATNLLTKTCFLVAITCFSVNAQEDAANGDKIKSIGDKACGCTKEISYDQPRDSIVEKINSCITTFIISDQMEREMLNLKGAIDKVDLDSIGNDTIVIGEKEKTIAITVDKDFDEIQQYMFENCSNVKSLIKVNNQKSKHSMSGNKKALKYYEEGDEYYRREQYDLALVSYNKAVKADNKFAFAWDNMGICYRKLGNYKKAIDCYQESLKIDPEGRMPLQNMAVAYEYLEDYKQSAATYLKFVELYPDDPEGYFGAGRVLYISEDYERGVDNMFKAYLLYEKKQSPYINDALQNLRFYYSDLDQKGKKDIFMEVAKKNNIQLD